MPAYLPSRQRAPSCKRSCEQAHAAHKHAVRSHLVTLHPVHPTAQSTTACARQPGTPVGNRPRAHYRTMSSCVLVQVLLLTISPDIQEASRAPPRRDIVLALISAQATTLHNMCT